MKAKMVFLGPPGAGKGTLAAILSKEKDIVHISTGDIFRREVKNKTELGKKADALISVGKLVPDQLVADIVGKRICEDDCRTGYILDGFPRTLKQAELFADKLEDVEQTLDIVVYFDAQDDLLLKRLTSRYMCKKCNAVYNKLYNPPTKEGICDDCGGHEFFQRDDDKLETAQERLKIYHKQTAPLIEYYESKGLLQKIDANNEVEVTYPQLLGVLN